MKDEEVKKNNDKRYKMLLKKIVETLNEKNPDLADDKAKIAIIPPKIIRLGTKKTAITNFEKICKQLDRNP